MNTPENKINGLAIYSYIVKLENVVRQLFATLKAMETDKCITQTVELNVNKPWSAREQLNAMCNILDETLFEIALTEFIHDHLTIVDKNIESLDNIIKSVAK